MTNNDVLRRIRYTFDFDDSKMMSVFASADLKVSREEISDWLKKDDDPAYKSLRDVQLATFLNGFINERRGKKDGPAVVPEKSLTNNLILRKLRIALDLKDDGMIEIMDMAHMELSKHELSAFFRKPGHKNYRECKDQVLRNFLNGAQIKYRTERKAPRGFVWEPKS